MLYRQSRNLKIVIAFIFILLVAAAAIPGCSNISYYAQSVAGGYEVLAKREPIPDVLQRPDIPQTIKDKLQTVLQIREFASRQLALPDNDSYRTYVDLHRPYVVWNVFAAPEFSMNMKEWCFLFVGCVQYRGYFDEQDARQYGSDLRQEGFDVYVTGIAAYSTIGWFDDPMMNTIIKRDEIRLAGLIFHELAHQVVYIKGDTAFNEGFAVTVELEGVRRWLDDQGSPELLSRYQERKTRHRQFVTLVTQTRDRLQVLYASDYPAEDMRRRKTAIIDEMKQQYRQLKTSWNGFSGYDRWFNKPVNNAQIAAVTTYRDYVPAFQQLLVNRNHDLDAFYQAVKDLGELSEESRQAAISELLPSLSKSN